MAVQENRSGYQLAILLVSSLSSAVAVGTVAARVLYTHTSTYTFLAWNLFLAWIPLLCALLADQMFSRRGRLTFLILLCGLVWLAFYPNAPYLVTDFLHLQERPPAPLWYDLLLIFSFAWTGLFLGFNSLYLMQRIVSRLLNRVVGWLFALVVLALGSFGVFLGRFRGWNSWDVLADPQGLAADILAYVAHPRSNWRTVAVWVVLAVVFTSIYLTLFSLTRLPREGGRISESTGKVGWGRGVGRDA